MGCLGKNTYERDYEFLRPRPNLAGGEGTASRKPPAQPGVLPEAAFPSLLCKVPDLRPYPPPAPSHGDLTPGDVFSCTGSGRRRAHRAHHRQRVPFGVLLRRRFNWENRRPPSPTYRET